MSYGARFEVVRSEAAQPWHARFIVSNRRIWVTENYVSLIGAERAILLVCRELGMPATGLRWTVRGAEKVLVQGTPERTIGPLVKYIDTRPDALLTPEERLENRLLRAVTRTADGCWLFTGHKNKGYGVFNVNRRSVIAHRVAHELWVGPIPKGLQVDHTCHNESGCNLGEQCPHRACVNPAHLEAVTSKVNSLRTPNTLNSKNAAKQVCPQGHPYDDANTYVDTLGRRSCRTCGNARRRKGHGGVA